MKNSVLAEPALVGREEELDQLQRYLDSVISGKGKTVLISGEAGSGKTRLTHEFLSKAIAIGVTVLSGWCLSDAAVPYFPFVRAFDSYFSSREEETPSNQRYELTTTLTGAAPVGIEGFGITSWLTGMKPADKAGKPEAFSPQIWKDQLFDAVGKTLRSISAQGPLILFIEDIHWADSASLALLHYISRIISSEKILVLATLRSEELTTDIDGRPHPLTETLRAMRRESLFTEIKLSNLDQAEISRIAENMVGGTLQSAFAYKLATESRGNPLFAVESLRMLSEQGSLVAEDDRWGIAVGELGIPSKFKDIILRRVAVLKHAQRRVLDAASVIGEKFDVELLSAVLGLDTLDVLETLDVVGRSTSLVRGEENYYQFDHMRSRETLYDELSPPLKKGYHERVAERLEGATKKGKLSFSEIAYHYTEAGNMEKAVEFSLKAGRDSLARFSNAEAVKHFTYVLQAIPESAENSERRRAAMEGLGDAHFANCRFKEAMDVFERLADAETAAVRLRAYRKAMDAGYWWESDARDPEHLQELARKAEPYVALDRLEHARIRFFRGSSVGLLRKKSAMDVKEGYEDVKEALRVFEEEYSLPDAGRALGALAVSDAIREGKVGISALLRSAAIYEELGDLTRQIDVAFFLCVEFFACGCFKESSDTWVKVLQTGEKIGDYYRMAQASMYIGSNLELEGLVEEGLPRTLKAEEYIKKTDATQIEATVYAFLMRQYSKLDKMDRAEVYFGKLMSHPWETYGTSFQFYRSVAVFRAAKNQWEEVQALFKKALGSPRIVRNRYFEMVVRIDYRWALLKQGRTEEAKVEDQWIKRILTEAEKKFAAVNVDANLMAPARIPAQQEFELRFDLVNCSKTSGRLVSIEGFVPPTFKVISFPEWCSLEDRFIEMKDKSIGPFKVVTVKLRLKPSEVGTFTLSPRLTYRDESGELKTCKSNSVTITVQQPKPAYMVLPNRVPTGYAELDALLLGGIPQNYAIALTAPSTEERKKLIRRFLETGAAAGETTFNVTTETANTRALAEKYSSNFYLFICNLQAYAMIQSAPNVFKLKGIENLTDIDIALTKAFRAIDPSSVAPRRICIDVVSDVLLQHHAVTTRRWLCALLPTLKSKGFTTLATINPKMHPPEESEAILDLFDGEIGVCEKEAPNVPMSLLRIRRLAGQNYLKDEIPLIGE